MPEHNDLALCKHCGGRITYIEETANAGGGHYEVLNAWWAHDRHPRDDHDGEPLELSERIRDAAGRESSAPAADSTVRVPFKRPVLHDLDAVSDPVERARLARQNVRIVLVRVGQALQAVADAISGRG